MKKSVEKEREIGDSSVCEVEGEVDPKEKGFCCSICL